MKYKPFANDVKTWLHNLSELHLQSSGQESSTKPIHWLSRQQASASLLYLKEHGKASKDSSILTKTNEATCANENLVEWGWVTMDDDDDVAHYASTVFTEAFLPRRVDEGMWKSLMNAQSQFVESLEESERGWADTGRRSIPELEEINKSLTSAKKGQGALEWAKRQADVATANARSRNEEVAKDNHVLPPDNADGESRGNKGKGKAAAA